MATLPDLSNTGANTESLMQQDSNDSNGLLPVTQDFAPELFESYEDVTSGLEPIKTEDTTESKDFIGSSETGRRDSSVAIAPGEHGRTDNSASPVAMKAPARPRKSDNSKKDSKHSSKNEGQHTDRRYLCYLCNKLFTRRRSVRDHISKIHNTKTWEPVRSLEIIVEPESGEPVGSLEEQIAQGGAPSMEKSRQDPSPEEVEESIEDPRKPPELPVLKTEASSHDSPAASIEPVPKPAPVAGKKRPLSINKKGIAKTKVGTPHKRPKLSESEVSTPFRSPSVASVQRGPRSRFNQATQSPTSSRAVSPDPSVSPSSSGSTPGSTNDDGEIFCICRKGDNHTWMIACDGPCEEWFHGNCVNIKERDGDLIDKYICPRCRKEGYQTTWKRMCRLKGCRKPAKVLDDPPSKYCSPECGRKFFVELISRGDATAYVSKCGTYIIEKDRPKKMKKRRRRLEQKSMKQRVQGDLTPLINGSRPHTPAYSDDDKSEYETDSSLDDDMLPNRGGALRAGEVKALLVQCPTIEDWRALGRKPETPPKDQDVMDLDMATEFDDFEHGKLASIAEQKAKLKQRATNFSAREKFLELVKDRSSKITEQVRKENPKQKELCGYDPRLTWTEVEFVQWLSDGGQEVIDSGQMNAPAGTEVQAHGNHDEEDEDEEDGYQKLPTKDGICVKNRCQRHGSTRWQKAQLAELRFEQDLVRRALEKLEQQEHQIHERALVRAWEHKGHH